MNIIVTGFEPFLNNKENPTQEIVRLLPKSIKGHQITSLELPVVFDECFDLLQEKIDELNPGLVICLGLAQGRNQITPERVALNLKSVSVADNKGNKFIDEAIVEDGENAYFSTLPLQKMVDKMKEKDIPAGISNTAGLYVCNNIMYHLLHYNKVNELNMMAGFIHVPMMDEQENEKGHFSLPLPTILEGVIDSIKACIL